MSFFASSAVFQIIVTRKSGNVRNTERFIFDNEREYRNKRVNLEDEKTIESIYCVEQHTNVSFEER